MKPGQAERIWLLLLSLTVASAWLAETGATGWPLSLLVAGLIAIKGRLVIDHYMEMRSANIRFRRLLHAFVTLIPILILISHGWGDVLRRWTSL
jgi:hypothetical protein